MTPISTLLETLLGLFAHEGSTVVWMTDCARRLEMVEGGVIGALGVPLPDFTAGPTVEEFFLQQEDAESSLLSAHERAADGEIAACEFDWYGWHFSGRVLPQLDDAGQVTGCLGVARLDTVFEALEDALEASEQRFETLVGLSPAGIYMTDEMGRCTYVNQRWCEMAGITAERALGHSWEQVIHPEDRAWIANRWREAVEQREVWEHEFRVLAPHGTTTWVLGQAKPLRDVSGRVRGYVGINVDITVRKEANAQLRASEERFARLLSAVTSYRYCVLFSRGVPMATEHSPSCVGTTGYAPEEYARDPFLWINMVHPEDRDLVREHVAKVLAGQSVPPMEHRIYHKNGSVRWVRDTIIAHNGEDGELIRYDGLVEDITDRKRLDRRLWQILESAPDAMVITDRAGQILMANGQMQRLFGYSRDELLHQPVEILIPTRFRASHINYRREYAVFPGIRMMADRPELFGCRKDGSEFAAEIVLSPIEMEDEVLVCAGIRDISHRKQIEQALRASEERFDLAVRGTDAGIWDWDLTTGVVYYSPRWKGMLGFQVDELGNDFAAWESRVHPDDLERLRATIRAYLDGETAHFELEHRLRHRDGSFRWILARGALVRDASGRACRMVGSHLDITDRKRAAEQLRDREAQLIAAQRIQEHLLPRHPPRLPEYDIAGRVIPAQFAGGDYYDYLSLADGTLAIVVGDVSGHDVSAALVTASTRRIYGHLPKITPTCRRSCSTRTRFFRAKWMTVASSHCSSCSWIPRRESSATSMPGIRPGISWMPRGTSRRR